MLLLNDIRHLDQARLKLAAAEAAFLAAGGRVQEIESGHCGLDVQQEEKLAERIVSLAKKGCTAAEICKVTGITFAAYDHLVAKRRIYVKNRTARTGA